MTEHWKDELAKLDLLQAPESLGHPADFVHADRPSRSVPERSAWARRATALFALSLFVGIGLITWSLFGSQRGPRVGVAATPAPEVADVRCNSDGTTLVMTPIVQPQRDGVHISVTSADSGFLYIQDPQDPDKNWGQDLAAPPGVSEVVLPIPPTEKVVLVACFKSEQARNQFGHISNPTDFPSLQITDSIGAWVSPDLSCPMSETTPFLVQQSITSGTADPPAIVRSALRGLKSSDVVELAAYPGWMRPQMLRIVRDGGTIADIQFSAAGGTVAVMEVTACTASGLSAG